MSRNYSSTAADTTLSSGVSSANTTLVVGATTGFPAPPFVLAVDAGAATQELVLVTAVGGTSLTVTRGYDSTVAAAHDAGAAVSHSHAAIDFRESRTHEAATATHGATGAVVGTTNTQTLTGKTLALADNTISGTKAAFNTAVTDGNPVWDNEIGLGVAYTPTLTNFPGTINVARYIQIGKLVHVYVKVTLTGAPTGAMSITLPVAPSASVPTGIGLPLGRALAVETGGGLAYGDDVMLASGSTVNFIPRASAAWNATIPFTWTSTDFIVFSATYEAA